MLPLLLLALACKPDPAPADSGGDGGTGSDGGTDEVPMVDLALADWCGDYEPGTGVEQGSDLWKVTLTDPAAVCNDGSPGVMYIRPAADPKVADQWVFYLQGGSTCQDLESCAVRWCGTEKYTKAKMSSTWTAESAGESPLFTREEGNPTGAANQVLLYYCSSDAWGGTRADVVLQDEERYPGEAYRLHFRGHEIVRAAVEQLMAGPVTADGNPEVTVPALTTAARVLWAGSSAGGRGAELHLDWVADQLSPHGTEVVGWFDAHVPILYDDMGAQGAELMAYDRDVRWVDIYDARYGLFLDSSCEAMHPGEDRWMCGNSEHLVLHHVTTPFFARQDLRDRVAGERYLTLGATEAEMATAWALTLDRVAQARSTGEEGHRMTRDPGMYGPNCAQHVGMNEQEWFAEATVQAEDGTLYTHRGAFLTWYLGAPLEVIDTQPSSRSVCPATTDSGG